MSVALDQARLDHLLDIINEMEAEIVKTEAWAKFRPYNENLWHDCTVGKDSAIQFLEAVIGAGCALYQDIYGEDDIDLSEVTIQ